MKSILKASAISITVVLACNLIYKAVQYTITDTNERIVHEVAEVLLPRLLTKDADIQGSLRFLESVPNIQAAELNDSAGLTLAIYQREGLTFKPEFAQLEGALLNNSLRSSTLLVVVPLAFDTQIIANLHVLVDLWPSYEKIIMSIGISLIFIVFFFLTKQLRLRVRFERTINSTSHT